MLSRPRHCRKGAAARAKDCESVTIMISGLMAVSYTAVRYADARPL